MKVLIALIVLAVSASAFAQKRVISVDAFDLAYSSGLSFKHDSGKGPDRDATNFRLNLNFAQSIEQYVGLMWKAQVNFNREDTDFGGLDTFYSSYGVAGGFLYNFQADDIKNSILAGASVGIERATYEYGSSDDESGFNMFMQFEAGKRWDLGSYSVANISYAPTVSVMFKRYGGDIRDEYFKSGNEIRFNFLKFDVLF
ncbi:MAG: hypothetical protein V4598_13185 [Bdellovibrionota bacterium]